MPSDKCLKQKKIFCMRIKIIMNEWVGRLARLLCSKWSMVQRDSLIGNTKGLTLIKNPNTVPAA